MPTLILDSKDSYRAKNCHYTHLPLGNMSSIWRKYYIQLDYPNEKHSADFPSSHHGRPPHCSLKIRRFIRAAVTITNPTPKGTFKSAGLALWAADSD